MNINETQDSIRATNQNRTVIKRGDGSNMNVAFTSKIIDFSDMPIGCVQAVWEGVVGYESENGYFMIRASCFRDPATFDYVRGSKEKITTANGTRMWNLGVIGYRYAVVDFIQGAITDGECMIVAAGKKT